MKSIKELHDIHKVSHPNSFFEDELYNGNTRFIYMAHGEPRGHAENKRLMKELLDWDKLLKYNGHSGMFICSN